MKKQDDMAMAILNMRPTRTDREAGIGVEEEKAAGDAVHMAAVEMLHAIKIDDARSFAEALRAAMLSCKYEDDIED